MSFYLGLLSMTSPQEDGQIHRDTLPAQLAKFLHFLAYQKWHNSTY